MRQARDLFAQHGAVAADVGGADFQEVVEAAGDHVAFLDLGDAQDAGVEFGEGLVAGVGQFHFGECDVVHAEARVIDLGGEAADYAAFDQPLEADLAGGLGQADLFGKRGDGNAAVGLQDLEDLAIVIVQIDRSQAVFVHFRSRLTRIKGNQARI